MGPHPTDGNLRETVLAAAIDIVNNEGVGALSMREVARRAGVSHQAPYHHFADKAEILAQISIQGFELLTEAMNDALASSVEPAEAAFNAYVTFALNHTGHFKIMFRPELCMVETHEGAKAAADRAMNSLMMLVRRVAPANISEREAFDWAVLLWAQVHGTATLLVDGPLARKLPQGYAVESMVAAVAKLAATTIVGGIQH
jgi:AcrR family transcriptional regulator